MASDFPVVFTMSARVKEASIVARLRSSSRSSPTPATRSVEASSISGENAHSRYIVIKEKKLLDHEPFGLNFTIAVSFRGGVGGGRGNYRFRGKLGVRFG